MRLSSPCLALCVAILAALSPAVRAGDDYDMSRDTPVAPDVQIPLEDFFRPQVFRAPQLNLSGTKIAALVTVKNDRHILFVYDLATRAEEAVGGQGDSDVYDVQWLNDKRVVFQLSTQKLWGMGFFAANVGDLSNCYPLEQFYGTSLVSVPRDNRLRPLVWNSYDGIETRRDKGVASLNTDLESRGGAVSVPEVQSGTLQGLSAARNAQENNERHIEDRYPLPPGITTRYMADKDGHLEYAFVQLGDTRTMFRLVNGEWVRCPIDTSKVTVIASGNQPGQLVARVDSVPGQPRPLRFLDAATGVPGEVLVPEKAYDFSGWVYRDPPTGVIIGAYSEREGPNVDWFTDTYQGLQKILNGFFPGVVVRILGSNEAQTIFLVGTFSDRQPIVYHWVDLSKRTAGLIKSSAPWIDPKRMRPMGAIKFKTRDGYTLDAYLTLPRGASKARPVPMVVLSHGGPWLRDSWGYNAEVQFLASRGYAVLQTNYRGSTGYDWMFQHGENWDFLKMHYDVVDATRAVLAMGFVDPDRVAIMGGSFGGYLAMEGVVDDPTLYRCAVTISGVFDWTRFFEEKKANFEKFGDLSFSDMMLREGDPELQKEKFDKIAPGRHIDRVRVPVFVSHGGYDDIADISQSTRLISELEKYHVPYEANLVATEVHGMAHLSNEVDLYEKIEAFLAKNLQPREHAASN